MYLAVISNPLHEQNQSFEDFRKNLKPKSAVPVQESKPEPGMTKQQIQNQLIQSQNILNSFIPPISTHTHRNGT